MNPASRFKEVLMAMSSVIAPYLQSRALPPLESYPTAFNNTAIQVVGRNLVITETFWEIPLHSGMDGARDESCDE